MFVSAVPTLGMLSSTLLVSLLVSYVEQRGRCYVLNEYTFVAETVKVPTMAESITEGTLKTWTKKVGDTVAQDEEVATIETDKVGHICIS